MTREGQNAEKCNQHSGERRDQGVGPPAGAGGLVGVASVLRQSAMRGGGRLRRASPGTQRGAGGGGARPGRVARLDSMNRCARDTSEQREVDALSCLAGNRLGTVRG